jgi:GWxTD domain-containing protein
LLKFESLMKKIILCLAFGALSLYSLATPRVFLNYYVFYNLEHEPYVETALQFASGSLKFKSDSLGALHAELEITQIFKQGEEIVVADKYQVLSPPMTDSVVDDFFDLKRFKLAPGVYDFELIVKDVIGNTTVTGAYTITVEPFLEELIQLSDFEFIQNVSKSAVVDNFTKNGYQLIPYFSDYFPPDYSKLVYYLECYNADKVILSGSKLAATFQLQDNATGEYLEPFFQYKKLKAEGIIPIINVLPIDDLKSGTYNLVVDIIDQNNDTLVHKVVPFKRRNDLIIEPKIVDVHDIDRAFEKEMRTDSIKYFLASLAPIAPQHETEKILKMIDGNDTTYMKQYFFSFWKETNPINPLRGWQDYKMQVYYAERLFGTQIKRGFQTDRGRIHLQYGAPNYVTDQPTGTSAYPYQIWHYYRIGQRSNVRFVFYNPDLVTNDFPLIHSDLPGEVQNQNWQQEILKRNNSLENFNQSIRGNSGIFFED